MYKRFSIATLLVALVACAAEQSTVSTPDGGAATPDASAAQADAAVAATAQDVTSVVQAKYFNGATVSTSGDSIVVRGKGLPDHKTPYYGVGNALYEDFPAGHAPNVNTSFSETVYAMTIPARPVQAATHEETTLGSIGLALNGVPIFNDREGGNVPVDAMTLLTFDSAGAHPGPRGDYHYHTTGKYTSDDDDKLVGFLRDGFPIYGRKDADGTYPADLDTYGGHTGPTTEFTNGIYHYHASNVNYMNSGYYVLKAGAYYGTKGTLTN